MGKHQQECDYLAMIASQAEEIAAFKSENIALRKVWGERCEELDALNSQKPIGYWRHTFAGKLCINKSLQCDIDGNSPELPDSTPLYVRPVPAIPEGYALVPIEPTRVMLDSAHENLIRDGAIDPMVKRIYKSMLSAAKEQSK